ncbi:MAG: hypothetical protein U0235_24135 [Polyangiaceae bacterium]
MNLEQWIVRTSVGCMFLSGAATALARVMHAPMLLAVGHHALRLAAAVAAIPLAVSALLLALDALAVRFTRSCARDGIDRERVSEWLSPSWPIFASRAHSSPARSRSSSLRARARRTRSGSSGAPSPTP